MDFENPVYGYILLVIMLILIAFVFLYFANEKKNITLNYYKNQTATLCDLSNQYRNMLITKNPELVTQLPPDVDCKLVNLP